MVACMILQVFNVYLTLESRIRHTYHVSTTKHKKLSKFAFKLLRLNYDPLFKSFFIESMKSISREIVEYIPTYEIQMRIHIYFSIIVLGTRDR